MFSTNIRPNARVRKLDAADLAVIPDPVHADWLIDSRGLLCLVPGCGAKVDNATGALAHREGCHR